MKKGTLKKGLLICLLVLLLAAAILVPIALIPKGEYDGKTVILHSNDVHGAVSGYACMAGLKEQYEDMGAHVITVDAGDFLQGDTCVNLSEGADAIALMNAVGYDVVTIGNHEFGFSYTTLMENLAAGDFQTVCCNLLDDGVSPFDTNTILEYDGISIGFFGVIAPETSTTINPSFVAGLTFLAEDELYTAAQEQVTELQSEGADIIICLSHLGTKPTCEPNRSTDLYNNTEGIDFIIDGHSHTVMTSGANGEPVQSTGTGFANIGVIVIDDATKTIEDNFLCPVDETCSTDATVAALAQEVIDNADKTMGEVFARSDVELCGTNPDAFNWNSETTIGDLTTDALVWYVLNYVDELDVPAENVVGVTNAGGIRADLAAGDISRLDINNILPFGNTTCVVYITGAKLLEALEASTYSLPDPLGGFPQISGINITIDTTVPYDEGELYPDSTYSSPASIGRVTIDSVNGKAFDENAIYAVATHSFCAAGGDTYYAFTDAISQFDTGFAADEAVVAYITEALGGVIGDEYAEIQGRTTIIE